MLKQWLAWSMCAVFLVAAGGDAAEFVNGGKAPVIVATDINGQQVNINELIEQQPYVVMVHFFSVTTGEEVALKLRYLHQNYPDKVKIIALGMKEDEAALKKFAQALNIQYYIIDNSKLSSAEWLEAVDVLPMTLFVHPSKDLMIERVISGGGKSKADVLKQLAETLFRKQKDASMAVQVADEAAKENPQAKEIKGYILASEGKLDEAEKEFAEIDSKTGLAAVAKERGQYDKAVELADQAQGDVHAATVKAQALMAQGKTDEAKAAIAGAPAAADAEEWKQSDAVNTAGRIEQATGNADGAIQQYEKAVAIDPLNVVALSNEGAALRDKGDAESLQKAETVLARASEINTSDQLVQTMLQQIQREMKRANDLERRKLIQQQIQSLSERFKEMQANPEKQVTDQWSSRPLVLAFLPSSDQGAVFFERAGTDVVLKRELEARLQEDGRAGIVEREMLDALLQELSLGSSELASAETQRRLGQVVSAGMLAFTNFANVGTDKMMYLRVVDTETTQIIFQTSAPVNEDQPIETVEKVQQALLDKLTGQRELKGLIAEASADDAIIINLGKQHGAAVGQQYTVLQDGEPLKVGGREIAGRQTPVAKIEVTQVEDGYSICKLLNKRDGVTLAKEMKVKVSQ